MAGIDIVDSYGNLINNKIATLERYESYTINAVCFDKDGNEVELTEKQQKNMIWRCSEPNGITFAPEYPVRGITTTLYGSVAPLGPETVTIDYNGIIATFKLSIVMPEP